MKNFINSILLVMAFAFTLSFAVPQQAQAKSVTEPQKTVMINTGVGTIFVVYTYFFTCSGEYLGACADIYDITGRKINSFDYDSNDKRI